MAANTITANNLTASPVDLADIGITVPASGSVVLTSFLRGFEILNSLSLRTAVANSEVSLDIGGGVLTQTRALDLLSSAPVAEGVSFSTAGTGLNSTTVQSAITEVVTSNPGRIDVYDSTGGQQYTTGLVVVAMNTVRQSVGGALTLQGNGSVLCNVAGSYEVTYDVSIGIQSGSARSNTESFLYLNNNVVPGTRRVAYNRTVGNDESSATGRAFLDLSPGDVVDVRVRRFTGTDTMITVQSSSLTLIQFKGAQGAPGTAGAQGPAGPAGSGSTINVSENSVLVSGSPFSQINFTGGLVATNGGGGQVNVGAGTGSGTSFPSSPFDGQRFYRTDLQWDFRWDATRGKWLGTTVEFEGAGFNASVNNNYLRRFNGMTTSNILGTWIPYNITIVGMSGRWGNNVTGSLQLRRDGATVSSISYTSAGFAADMTLNDNFAANGNMSFFVNGSHDTPQVRVWYRRRGT